MAKKATEQDNMAIIQDGLQRYGGWQKAASNNFTMVQCPFHDDRGPSCGVYLSYTPYKAFKLGDFRCFGCGARGDWNVFAERVGVQTIKAWASKQMYAQTVTPEVQDKLLGQTDTLKGVFKRMSVPEAQPWPDDIEWRSFEGKFLSEMRAYIASDHRNSSVCIVFPIYIGKRVRGGVKGVFERKENDIAFITCAGDWVSEYGLLGYEMAKRLMRENRAKFVIACEGPRDALRLLSHGIPAVAILGSQNQSQKKMKLLLALGVDQIYVMPDNDSGGTKMWLRAKELLGSLGHKAIRIKLPRNYDKNGKLIKIDPGNMGLKLTRQLCRFLMEKHHEFSIETYFVRPRKVREATTQTG